VGAQPMKCVYCMCDALEWYILVTVWQRRPLCPGCFAACDFEGLPITIEPGPVNRAGALFILSLGFDMDDRGT